MSFTLDALGQLQGGFKAYLQQVTQGLVDPDQGIRTAYPDADMVEAVGNGPGQVNPLLVISFAETKPSKIQPGQTSAKTITGPIVQVGTEPATQTVLTETRRLLTPVCIGIWCAGKDGKVVRGQLSNLIASSLDSLVNGSLPLPDSLETWTLVTDTVYGLSAVVTYTSEAADDKYDLHDLYGYNLYYQASHSRYQALTYVTVQAIEISVIAGTGVVPQAPIT